MQVGGFVGMLRAAGAAGDRLTLEDLAAVYHEACLTTHQPELPDQLPDPEEGVSRGMGYGAFLAGVGRVAEAWRESPEVLLASKLLPHAADIPQGEGALELYDPLVVDLYQASSSPAYHL